MSAQPIDYRRKSAALDPPTDYYRINGHGHVLPRPEQVPRFMRDQEIFWISDDREYMHQKGWKRPIDSDIYFAKERIEWLQTHDIDHEVILNLSQLYANDLEGQLLHDVIRFQNDFNHSLQVEHPQWFTPGFVLQARDRDFALDEMRRCVEDLGMRVLCLPTHFMHEDGTWTSIASDHARPIFELADHYHLAIEIHPYDGQKIIQLQDQYWRFHLVWMCAQTADAYHMFTMKDFHNTYPHIRTCFAHGNQFGQVNVGRRKQGYKGRPDLFADAQDPMDAIQRPNIYFDTLTHDLLALELMVKRQGAPAIIAGLDDPYPLGEVDHVDDSYPGKVIDEAVLHGILSTEDRRAIWRDNVINWLAGDDKERRHQLTNRIKVPEYEL